MPEAYIVDAVRTPVGRRKGGFTDAHPADMAAHVIRALVERGDFDAAALDDVVLGCIDQIGSQAGDIARTAALAAGLPESVPGVTIDRQCGSSQQAVHFAAMGVMSGAQDLVIAGGVQKMTQYPILSAFAAGAQACGGPQDPWTGSKGWEGRYTTEISQFKSAEMIAEKWGISREEMEVYALESHARALAARAEGRFDREILAYGDIAQDEGPRDTSLEKMAALDTLVPGGRLTAAVSSQVSDGASAMLIASDAAVKAHGLTPRARIHHISVRGADPVMMLHAPIPATQYALEKAGMSLDDIDLVEINEAFASVVLAWEKDLEADHAKVNVNGGAIALGHPIGATGTRLMTTLLHELERTGGRYGLQTMCEGGGQANVTIIERI
ncbi:acetyl-CoA C-acetyltransferase [Nocardia sp. CA-151230]|uniref:acetyl-CoA C-acetyltransferase n=1 Tax=Nocardia sp. CA-151230 TaxID=3239982 RepID=UPI003D91179F